MSVVVPEVGLGFPGPEPARSRLRRAAIVVFFTSVVVNALLGLSALLVGEFSDTHGKILGTSLLVTASLLGALACAPAWERRALVPVPLVGAAASLLTGVLGIVGLWSETESDTFGKLLGTSALVAGGGILASLLAFPVLAPRFRPVLVVAVGLDGLSLVLALLAMWLEIDSTTYARGFGAVAVLLAASAVSVPVLAKIGRPDEAEAVDAPVAFCPYCGAAATTERGTSECAACGRAFSVRRAR